MNPHGDGALVRRLDLLDLPQRAGQVLVPSSRNMVMEKTTSSAVIGVPSWNAASGRSRKRHVRRSSLTVTVSAA
jgi:hypothetical protein